MQDFDDALGHLEDDYSELPGEDEYYLEDVAPDPDELEYGPTAEHPYADYPYSEEDASNNNCYACKYGEEEAANALDAGEPLLNSITLDEMSICESCSPEVERLRKLLTQCTVTSRPSSKRIRVPADFDLT